MSDLSPFKVKVFRIPKNPKGELQALGLVEKYTGHDNRVFWRPVEAGDGR